MNTDGKFCTRCGKNISAEAQFCSECGAPVEGSRADAEMKKAVKDYETAMAESRRTWVIFLMVLFSIPAIVIGVYMVFSIPQMMEVIVKNADYISWAEAYNVTPAMTESMLNYFAYLMLASGACVAVAAVCVVMRRYWLVAVILTLIGSFLFCGSIFGVLIGLLVTWMIYTMKDTFTNDPVKG